ncbi:ABC transporter permease [Xanthobacteraceae bacterium Astr-EGSB]|uniref:ABC transporter permease n=1 Tax=Astrobacterium formosum TaxID=3069710 RepID=UPI0027B2F7FF|nr:ABC transporter permease [Xanthobacteraceae bacterium Astr-EGSB]
MLSILRAIWRYRNFILSSIRTEFSNRFGRSRLGALWMVMFPLVQTALFALVLSAAYSVRLPEGGGKGSYALYLLAGMLAWAVFAEIVNRCLTVFIENSSLLKKLVFPRICLPIIVCGSAIVTNLVLLVVTLSIFFLFGSVPGLNIIWLPFLMVLNIALAIGLGIILGILNVFVRDVGHVVGIALQMMFWLTPIVYVPSAIPPAYQRILQFNPLYYLVQGYQNVMVFDTPPPWLPLSIITALTITLLGLAMLLFRRASEEIVDVL